MQHGRRYAVIVQADDLLALSTVIVCPTFASAPAATFHADIELGDEAVDARALAHIGHLSRQELRAVDDALLLVLDLA